jgi:hypothetical protein
VQEDPTEHAQGVAQGDVIGRCYDVGATELEVLDMDYKGV